MKKIFFSFLAGVILTSAGWLGNYYFKKTKTPEVVFQKTKASYGSIYKKTMATGSIMPRKEVNVKSAVSGIVDELYVGTGSVVKKGDLVAKIKIIPNTENLTRAKAAVKSAQIEVDNALLELNRSSGLLDKGLIAQSEYDQVFFNYNVSAQKLDEAKESLEVIKKGASKNSGQVLNEIRATISGTILGLGALTGDQIIESNTFNEGTTIVTIADMGLVYFSGKVDESEVGKLEEGLPVILSVGAIENETFDGTLDFIAPKGVDEEGTVKFTIHTSIEKPDSTNLRAGYSANAEIVLDKRENVLTVNESNIIFENDSTFVEVETEDQTFEKRHIEIGLSNGYTTEVISGLDTSDVIKIQNSENENYEAY